MLNLSPTRVLDNVQQYGLSSVERISLPTGQRMFRRWVLVLLAVSVAVMFLPWVQNFRAEGTVTAYDPASRPQEIQATIPGRIAEWYVFEGDTVRRGDTIARLEEIKPEYLDPRLVERTGLTRQAKQQSAEGYLQKAGALAQQAANTRRERELKLEQARNKLEQARLYVETLAADLAQQRTQVEIAENQEQRIDSLYSRGLKSLTELQQKRLKTQEARAKLTEVRNKLDQARTDVAQAQLAIDNVAPEYAAKLAKIESDRQSALTSYYSALGEVAKLESQESSYAIRSGYTYVAAPQSGTIARIARPGLGETVKEQEEIATILPISFAPAVEMYVEPFNLPLVRIGEEVRFLFDGWPAIVFSGWPGASYGTFVGEIVAVDNIIDEQGRYRVLVVPDREASKPWPDALRPGSGAEGVVLLNRVPVWYELWRQLNAFPPNYYEGDDAKGKSKEPKTKAAAKRVAK